METEKTSRKTAAVSDVVTDDAGDSDEEENGIISGPAITIKKAEDYRKFSGFSRTESAVFAYNGIAEKDIASRFTDLGGFPLDFSDYESCYEHLGTKEVSSFLSVLHSYSGKKVTVIGDYDADGIFATVILSRILRLCGYKTCFFIPDRFDDGYGMKRKQIDSAIAAGASLIITCDNGITCNDAINYAKKKKLGVIVTDHHIPNDEPLNADAVCDPWAMKDVSFQDISGATVALKLAFAMAKEFDVDAMKLNDLCFCAGITVLSDCMMMEGENRVLVKSAFAYGNTQVYKDSSFVNRLSRALGFFRYGKKLNGELCVPGSFRDFDVDNVNFYFVPIVNSVNRVKGDVSGLVNDILSFFSVPSSDETEDYVRMNQQRKYMKTAAIGSHVKDESSAAAVEILNMSGKGFTQRFEGIIGLVASSIVENEHKPAFIGIEDGTDGPVRFSGRSVAGFDLYDAVSHIQQEHPNWKLAFGGHAEAMGLSMPRSIVTDFRKALSDRFSVWHGEGNGITLLSFTDAKPILEAYSNLYPFGQRFVFPTLWFSGAIASADASTKTFTMYGMHGIYKIMTFDYSLWKTVSSRFANKKKLTCTLSVVMDENGSPMLRLGKILDGEDMKASRRMA